MNLPMKDKDFDAIYPSHIRAMCEPHFTEVDVAIAAAKFLAEKPGQRILDIGCGAGKFCFVAGACTAAIYTGVDYRGHFISLCKKLELVHRFRNVNFIHDNILNVDFSNYTGFYFFNSFEEHIDERVRLDTRVEIGPAYYRLYSDYVRAQFERLPEGTRVVTYHANASQVPSSYRLVSVHFAGLLKCWEKTPPG